MAAQRIFHNWAQLPMTHDEFMAKQTQLQRQHFPRTQPLPGVRTLLSTLQSSTSPKIHLALATSSHAGNFGLKTSHLEDLFSAFPAENRVLGDDKRIKPGRGKPAPDIYLLALETINARLRQSGEREVEPAECLVFEDSVPGVEAGRRAGMQVVWCPHPGLLEEYRGREKEVLAGLMGEHKEDDGFADEAKAETARIAGQAEEETGKKVGKTVNGRPGQVDDGWARLFETLEDFPYESYGVKRTANL
ncbi:hypothetical protein H2201_002367 [Coniosporium apollinis]|uniref:HAD superfamily hydrolase n=1 Tax=Coniosporium apollinis TaxID=61459 RepID=A0ABQ9NZS6_9PEZI|nr:hypothetical protein H2201_002367 [Coniosporium apollinis]